MEMDKIKNMVAIQCSSGNWNYDPYMHGMANGMILIEAMIEGKEPQYLDAPKKWLKDIKLDGKPTSPIKQLEAEK